MPHQTRQIGLARVQHQVIVISHLATGEHLSIEPVHRLSDDFQMRGPVLVVAVDWLTPVATSQPAPTLDFAKSSGLKKILKSGRPK